MNFLDFLRAFGFSGQEADIPAFICGFDSIAPEFAPSASLCHRRGRLPVAPASITRSPGTFDDATRSVEAVLTTEQAVIRTSHRV